MNTVSKKVLFGVALILLGLIILAVSNSDNSMRTYLGLGAAVLIILALLFYSAKKQKGNKSGYSLKALTFLRIICQLSPYIGAGIAIGVMSIAFEQYVSALLTIAIGFFLFPSIFKQYEVLLQKRKERGNQISTKNNENDEKPL